MSIDAKSALTLGERTRKVATILWITLILNWAVAALKVTFGLATRCVAMTADGVHSITDGTSNIVGLVAIYVSGNPPDRDHPYGHQKYETFASITIGFFLFLAAFAILRGSLDSFIHSRVPEVSLRSFLVMTVTLLVNIFVVWYERRNGKKLGSDFLISDSWHTLSDIFVTLGVFAAFIGIYYKVPRVDAVFSFVIAIIIMITAVNILKRGSDVLCDRAVLEAERIEKIVRTVEGVRDCHEIRTRGRKDNIYVDLHVLVDNDMTVLTSHRLANVIEREIRKGIAGVADVVVHIEPVTHDHNI